MPHEITAELADKITRTAYEQFETSSQYKQARMQKVKENEDLYLGIAKKQLKNPFNECFPFMAGFVDHFLANIDDPPKIEFTRGEEADLKVAQKVTSAYEKESASEQPNAKWAYKDRVSKKGAIFSGRGIMKYYAESDPEYKSHLEAVDHYDFHCEPDGGGILEMHSFCGQEGIFRSKAQMLKGAKENWYDPMQVKRLVEKTNADDYKDVEDAMQNRLNRHRALGLDPANHSYAGQESFRLIEWYLEYDGERYQVIFDEKTQNWVRIKPMEEVFKSGLYPYTTWATNEDLRVFWSKGPADDARPIAHYINRVMNQLLYNREKQNMGQRAFDADMFKDVAALADWRPDGLIPVDTNNGSRNIRDGIYEFKAGGMEGTIDLVSFLDSYTGQKTGSAPSAQGASEDDKKVGVFFGEIQQVDKFIGTKNKSYKEAWAELGIRYVAGLEEHLKTPMSVQLMGGASGAEWTTLIGKEIGALGREFDIIIKGGTDEEAQEEISNRRKAEALTAVQNVNPEWRDRELLRIAGYSDEDIKRAFSKLPMASQELMSEAAQAIEMVVKGKMPRQNRGANRAWAQKIIDFATDFNHKDEAEETRVSVTLYKYVIGHAGIIADNEARSLEKMIWERNMEQMMAQEAPEAAAEGVAPVTAPDNPVADIRAAQSAVTSNSLQATNIAQEQSL